MNRVEQVKILLYGSIFLQIGGIDRSWQRPPGVAAKLIDSKSSNGDDCFLLPNYSFSTTFMQPEISLSFVVSGLYYIEYTLKSPGESMRHLYSVLGVANNGTYNRLYTLTGQVSVDMRIKCYTTFSC